MVNSSATNILNHVAFAVGNGVSVVVCLLAVILILRLKLHKKLVYRLALYQVLSALVTASVGAMQVVVINYDEFKNNLCSHMHCYWIAAGIHTMDEAALHDVGDLSSLLFCGTPQEF